MWRKVTKKTYCVLKKIHLRYSAKPSDQILLSNVRCFFLLNAFPRLRIGKNTKSCNSDPAAKKCDWDIPNRVVYFPFILNDSLPI